ncbi:MAG: redox-sensitive transcriptional activator SoxR [Acidimicrobiales bacterium]
MDHTDHRRPRRSAPGGAFGAALYRPKVCCTRGPPAASGATRDAPRRIGFIRAAQRVGLSLEEIREALASLPDNRTPDHRDWARLSRLWRPRLDRQIALLENLRARLDGCIGCGCLSLQHCALFNPDDRAGRDGSGARFLLAE